MTRSKITTPDELVAKMKGGRLLLYYPHQRGAILAQSGHTADTGHSRPVHLPAFRAALKQGYLQEQTHHHGWFGGPVSKYVYELNPKLVTRKRKRGRS